MPNIACFVLSFVSCFAQLFSCVAASYNVYTYVLNFNTVIIIKYRTVRIDVTVHRDMVIYLITCFVHMCTLQKLQCI